ncbi:hypothetical protein ThidrDRAFT_0417 [Thiorhodococcus drewsii AZ1]|uniref:DUF4139 domain-containing protein n=1 Tax=Thiorhodococcus drewsii AZ1 TaxID=765913 RepID=G2DWM8_9GAMM|nr:DUF4139 domain-containing protein [Thiorhodococcus drewsii]EGV33728.1 hypothetical protein ThidrDRAFT_0417 [Thiorhodococcus drewsii AZ1]
MNRKRPAFSPAQPRYRLHAAVSLAALALGLFSSTGIAMDQERRVEDSAQQGLAVTIYNQDLALIKDQRQVTLEHGENRLAWRQVSAHIRPETALLTSVSEDVGLTLLEQNFDYDLLTPQSLLKKYVGRKVEVVRTNDAGERTTESATLLAVNDGPVLRYADRIETQVVGHLAFPDVPDDLRDEPTLVLHLRASEAGERDLQLSYLTSGLSWKADYVADLSQDERTMDLSGWVTLTNASGIALRQAQIQLVAGEVNQVSNEHPMPLMRSKMAMAAAAPMPEEEALAEYHLYTLPRQTDILNQQTKQVALLSASQIPVTKELVVRGQPYAYQSKTGDGWSKLAVESLLKFVNRDGSLGIPLPKGVIRVYTKDSQGHAQFIGEDGIDHTPKNETVALKLGESFDVTARRKQTAFKKLSGSSAYNYAYEASFEMELKNAKPTPAKVRVIETLPGDWDILKESQPHTKEASNLASWVVEVPADGGTTLSWRTQVRF